MPLTVRPRDSTRLNKSNGIFLEGFYFVPRIVFGWFTATCRILVRVGAPLFPLIVTVGFAFFSVP